LVDAVSKIAESIRVINGLCGFIVFMEIMDVMVIIFIMVIILIIVIPVKTSKIGVGTIYPIFRGRGNKFDFKDCHQVAEIFSYQVWQHCFGILRKATPLLWCGLG
jgi:hypothetical protein